MDDAGVDRFWPPFWATFWAMAPAEVLSAIGASDVGLGGAEAAARLERFGPNRSVLPSGRRFIQRLLRRLIEPLVGPRWGGKPPRAGTGFRRQPLWNWRVLPAG